MCIRDRPSSLLVTHIDAHDIHSWKTNSNETSEYDCRLLGGEMCIRDSCVSGMDECLVETNTRSLIVTGVIPPNPS